MQIRRAFTCFSSHFVCCLPLFGHSYYSKSDKESQSCPHLQSGFFCSKSSALLLLLFDVILPSLFFMFTFWFRLPPQVLADAVSRLVVDRFSELTDNFASPHARRKVLAGVVMTTGNYYFFVCPTVASENIQPSSKRILEALSMSSFETAAPDIKGIGYWDTAAKHFHRVEWLKRCLVCLFCTKCVSTLCVSAGTWFSCFLLFLSCDCDPFVFYVKYLSLPDSDPSLSFSYVRRLQTHPVSLQFRFELKTPCSDSNKYFSLYFHRKRCIWK